MQRHPLCLFPKLPKNDFGENNLPDCRKMNFSAWSIRNPVPVILLFILLAIAGVSSFRSLSIQDMPDVELPVATVAISLPGASPTQLESEVARKVEGAVSSLAGVRHVFSTINDGLVVITVQFRLEREIRDAMDDVRDAVSRIRGDLPADARDPVISKPSTSGRSILTYTAASQQLDLEALSWYVDNNVSKALLSVPGVGKISRIGGVSREVRVEIDPGRLSSLNISTADISRQLQKVLQESPSGKTDISGAQQSVRTINTAATVAEVAKTEMALPDGRRFRLDQVATVTDTVAEPNAIALLNGMPVIGFEVVRSKGAGEVSVAAAVRRAVAGLNGRENRVVINEAFNSVEPVQESYKGSMLLLYEGAVLAVIVVWLFLRNGRATVVAAAALPLSILPTFIVMYFLGFTLNMVTLLSMALVVGVLVDDAIVEIENIVRHLEMGKTPYQAAMEATNEIGLAVIATTFTLVAVFLPTAFMSGVAGKFFKQFGWTAAVAVTASLVVARLLTPMMAAYLLKPGGARHADSAMMTRYLDKVNWCLRHRHLALLAACGFFLVSLALIPLLDTGFIPPSDRSQTMVAIELPPGSTLAQTRDTAERARLLLMQEKNITQVYTAIGSGAEDADAFSASAINDARKAILTISLTHRTARSDSQTEIESRIRTALEQLPGARVSVGTGDTGEKLEIVLSGDNPRELVATSQRVLRAMRSVDGLGNITSSASLLRPEVIVVPNVARAADLGVTAAAIGETLRVATAGDYDQALAKLNLPERQVPIRVRIPEAARQDLSVLARLPVPGKNGNVMLGTVADLNVGSGPAQIDRIDRNQNVTISAELNGLQLGEALARVNALPVLQRLPPNIKRERMGDAEMMRELFSSFGLAMAAGILCVYMVLVLLFKDFLQPITILAALPLSVGGGFCGVADHLQCVDGAIADRAPDADGHRGKEFNPAGRICDRGSQGGRHEAFRCVDRCVP
jgi:multidrug efflux pump subunit AcrB